ncbi:MAG: GNAT family N-acetyltransferase [Pyrinomonadaceae bacterium]
MFAFRNLTPEDFPLMLEWLAKPHVKKWWNDGDDTLEKIARHYGKSDGTARFILSDDERRVGYFQYYFAGDGSIGIDQFIGEEDYVGRGVGTKTIKMFVDLIANKHLPARIILDPSPENKRAIRCYEKVGFKHFENAQNSNGDSAYMMRLEISPHK